MGIAFFDLDGTITKKDTYIEFIKYARGKLFFLFGITVLSPFILLFYLKIIPNYKLKEYFFSFFFKNYSETQLNSIGKLFCESKMPRLIYKTAIERIKWHQNKNHRIIILTASSPIWLSDWCAKHKIELIGTKFESINGKFTGKIDGKNCFGEQKKVIVKKILSTNKYSETYGYGDSKSDLPFLNELDYTYFGSLKHSLNSLK